MYFYKHRGKQCLDLTGNLVLSHNPVLVRSRSGSADPFKIRHSRYIANIPRMGWRYKLKATFAAIRFIWGHDRSLTKFPEGR